MAEEKDKAGTVKYTRAVRLGVEEPKEPQAANVSSPQWTEANADLFPGANLPSFFANRFQILLNNGMARLAFGESLFGEQMRASIVVAMTMPDAKELVRVLSELINQVEQEQAAASQQDTDGKPNKN